MGVRARVCAWVSNKKKRQLPCKTWHECYEKSKLTPCTCRHKNILIAPYLYQGVAQVATRVVEANEGVFSARVVTASVGVVVHHAVGELAEDLLRHGGQQRMWGPASVKPTGCADEGSGVGVNLRWQRRRGKGRGR